jgi:hypothetical protein
MAADNQDQGFNLIIEGDGEDAFAGLNDSNLIEVPDELLAGIENDADEQDKTKPAEAEHGQETGQEAVEDDDDPIDPSLPKWAVKSIKKEKFKKHEAERLAEAARLEAEQLKQELAQYQQHYAIQQNQQTLAELEAERKATYQQLKEVQDSFEDDADDKALELQEKLAEINIDIVTAKRGGTVAPRQQAKPEANQAPQATAQPVNQAQAAWLQANPQYVEGSPFQQAADQVYYQLRDEQGMRDDHPNFYKTLNERLQAIKPYTGAAGGPARGNEGGNGKTSSDGWDPEIDPLVMKQRGKNPNDPKQRAEYLNNQKRFGGARFK